MKKVGLITFFHDNNVGTCLQAYALQRTIKSLGYEVEIIDYKHQDIVNKKESMKRKITGIVKTYCNINVLFYFRLKCSDIHVSKKFDEYRNREYSLSRQRYIDYNDLVKANNIYDAFICGSDMIWTPDFEIEHRAFFLQFCDPNKRIAYAPSFGTDIILEQMKAEFANNISNIKYLSCRETSGKKLIKELTGLDAKLVLDPTQLVTKEDWERSYNLRVRDIKEKYILCYLFKGDNKYERWYKKQINKTAKYFNAKVRYFPISRKQQINELKYGDASYGPIEFMRLIYNAEFVITNSYHGLMFSMIFEKPFIVVRRGNSIFWSQFEKRFESVLEDVNENKRILSITDSIDVNILTLDYTNIRRIMKMRKRESFDYLLNTLKSVTEIN